jgi:hypothetical protein
LPENINHKFFEKKRKKNCFAWCFAKEKKEKNLLGVKRRFRFRINPECSHQGIDARVRVGRIKKENPPKERKEILPNFFCFFSEKFAGFSLGGWSAPPKQKPKEKLHGGKLAFNQSRVLGLAVCCPVSARINGSVALGSSR